MVSRVSGLGLLGLRAARVQGFQGVGLPGWFRVSRV